LPATAFQGQGMLRFVLPQSMVVLKTGPSMGSSAVPALTELLRAPEADTRIQAASAVSKLGIEAAPAVDALIPLLADSDPLVRAAGLQALGKIGSPSRKALREVLANVGDTNTMVAHEASGAIDKLRPFTAGDLSALTGAIQDPKADVRRFAIAAVAGLGADGATAASSLRAGLTDTDPGVRAAAALALGKIGSDTPLTIQALTQSLKDKDSGVRKNAASALGRLHSAEGAKQALIQALKDDDDDVFGTAAAELSIKGRLGKSDVSDLLDVVQAKKPSRRAFVATTLGRVGSDSREAIEALGTLLKDSDASVRRDAAKSLAASGPKAWICLAPLLQALDDSDPTVQEPAIVAVGHLGLLARAAVPKLIKARKNPALHEAANQALVQVGKGDLPAVLRALDKADGIKDRHELIGILGKMGPDAAEAIPALSKLAANANLPSTREAAKEALEKIQKGKGN
jgi:HEAT repeat protein